MTPENRVMINYPTPSQGARLTSVHLKNEGGEEIGRIIAWMMDVSEGRVIDVVAESSNAQLSEGKGYGG